MTTKNAYEECWGILKDIISNKRCSGLSSDSSFAYGLRTAYEDVYFLMNVLERICGAEKPGPPEAEE